MKLFKILTLAIFAIPAILPTERPSSRAIPADTMETVKTVFLTITQPLLAEQVALTKQLNLEATLDQSPYECLLRSAQEKHLKNNSLTGVQFVQAICADLKKVCLSIFQI